MDTAMTANLAYNVLRGRGFETSLYGTNFWAFHFQPFIVVYAALLFLKNSAMTLMFLQAATTASIPIAVYLLVKNRAGDELPAFAALAVTATSPFLFHIVGANVQAPIHLAAFFLWSVYFLEAGRFGGAAVWAVLALSTCEQAPFAYAGAGLYRAWERGRGDRKELKLGAGIAVAAAAVFLLEMLLMYSYPAELRYKNWGDMYGHLGESPTETIKAAVFAPREFAGLVLWPPERFRPLFGWLLTTGFFGLAAPAAAVTALINFAPSFLSATGSAFHGAALHYAAQVGGPFWWAAAAGAATAHERLKRLGRERWLLFWAAGVSAFNLTQAPRIVLPRTNPTLIAEAPAILARIPPDAAVWSSEWLTSWLGGRSFLKSVPMGDRRDFDSRLFAPDYIVLAKDWIARADRDFSLRFLSYMDQAGFVQTAESVDLLLYRIPAGGAAGGGRPLPDGLPKPTPRSEGLRASLMKRFVVKYFQLKTARHPNDPAGYVGLGMALAALGREAEAVDAYERGAGLDGAEAAEAKNNLANFYLRRGDRRKARAYYESALADAPENAGVLFNFGNFHLYGGDYELAIAAYMKALESEPRMAKAYSNMGAAYFKAGRREDAVAAFRKALAIDPGFADARKNLEALMKGSRAREK